MQCPQCQHQNRDERHYCAECGARLSRSCTACAFENEPGERFCGGCGVSLMGQSTSSGSDPPVHRGVEAEKHFQAVLLGIIGLLQHDRRVTYRTLKYVFDIDDAGLDDMRAELTFRRLARDEDGKGLVWTGQDAMSVPITEANSFANGTTATLETLSTDPPKDEPAITTEPTRTAPDAERRQLTVMFCDLVGSTDLSARLDPEDLREVVRAYQEVVAEVVRQYDGYIAQYLGDGLLIYFGYPVAHEDDAQRAVYTGLGIPEAIANLNARLEANHSVQLAVRLGIHTGPVVVGEIGSGGRQEHLALGETPNIAARLEGLAPPNAVVMSPATAQLVQRSFILEELGSPTLKGLAEPMPIFGVVGPRTANLETAETTASGFDALVGRDEEIGLLLRCWEQSKEGVGQVVLLSGAAGIGKSSLVEGLRDQVRQKGLTHLAFRCSPYHQNSALYPVITYIERLLAVQPDDTPDTKLAKLEQVLQRYPLSHEEVTPLLADLLSIPLPEGRYPGLDLLPQQQRQRTHDALVAWLLAEAERQPLLAVWEDLHWADPSTLELLGVLLEQAPTVPMLNVLTFRPEFEPPWAARSHQTPMVLNRLERAQVVSLIGQAAHRKTLPEVVVEHIVQKADGVPLYAEELTKMLLVSELLREEEAGYVLMGQLAEMAIPDTLQDSLMARLDQVDQAKEVAQLGAILGREFGYDMLRAISARDDATLQGDLARLVEAELLYQRGRPPRATYIFKHALIQDAAYASLLRSTRQQVHQQVARLLEERFSEMVETRPELVAYHHTEAGNVELALAYWQRAGQRASHQSAYREAISHFEQALAALARLPENDTTMAQAIDLRDELSIALIPFDEYEQMLDHMQEAARLAEALSDQRRIGYIASRMAPLFYEMVDYDNTIATCQRALALAAPDGDISLSAGAHLWLGFAYHALGDHGQARAFLSQNVTMIDGELRYEFLGRLIPPSVTSRAQLVRVLAELGAFAEGLAHGAEARQVAETLGHPPSQVLADESVGFLYLCKGDFDRALAVFERSLAQRQAASFRGFEYPAALASLGYAYARCGHVAKGLPLLEQAVAQNARSLWAAWLSEVHVQAGHWTEACALADHALDLAQRHKERGWETHIRRFFGDLALCGEAPDLEAAESHYRQSLELAEALGMRPLQAHCHRDLGKLYGQTGRSERARADLSTAIEMYQEMEMTFWLPETEAARAAMS